MLCYSVLCSVNIFEHVGQMETDVEPSLPSEIFAMIIRHFDGRTMLKFKMLSKSCYIITNSVCQNYKLWKKICVKEIPRQYILDLLYKRVIKYIPIEMIPEYHFEWMYKHWLLWQKKVFNKTLIGEQHFQGVHQINIIICHGLDVKVIFKNYMCTLSLIKLDKKVRAGVNSFESFEAIIKQRKKSNSQAILYKYDNNPHKRTTYFRNGLTVYKTNNANIKNSDEHYTVLLTFVDSNTFATKFWHHTPFNSKPARFHRDLCSRFIQSMYSSIDHGLIIGRTNCDDIVIHDIIKDHCTVARMWLDHKYSVATAMYIYMNIMFIGTQNGYLLAYRLQTVDDLIHPKRNKLLLEDNLSIGRIIRLDIIDSMNVIAVVVASTSKVVWIKIN